MSKMLNEKQQELVEKNHNLIYKFAKNKGLAIDEYYGILAIGLCKAALAYDENKGKFSTIAYCCMSSVMKEHYRCINRQRTIPEDKIVSYNSQIGDEDIDKSYIDTIADDCCVQDTVISNIITERIMDTLNDKERTIAKLLIDGMTHSEISAKLGYSRQNITYHAQQMRKKIVHNV